MVSQRIIPAFLSEYRRGQCVKWNRSHSHQVYAGLCSWSAFSARWRASQGLMPLDRAACRKYVRPDDICLLGEKLPRAVSVVVWYCWSSGIPVDVASLLVAVTGECED